MRTLLAIMLALVQGQAPTRDIRPPAETASVSGRITDAETGEPIARAIVIAMRGGRSVSCEAVADDDGRYVLDALEPGDYVVFANPPQQRATHLRQALGRREPMDPFALPSPNLRLEAGEGRVGADIALMRSLAIEGRVLDPWEEPMADVEVRLVAANGGPWPAAGGHSDDRGEYRIYGLGPGAYRVCALAGNRRIGTENARLVRTCYPGSASEATAREVVLGSRDATGIDIRMQRVAAYTVAGSVVDEAGRPVPNATVVASALGADGAVADGRAVDGRFVLRGVPVGHYHLSASAAVVFHGPTREPTPTLMGLVELTVGGDQADVIVAVAEPHTVSGRIVFEGTPPAPASRSGLAVGARAVDRGVPYSWRRAPVPVDHEGTFTLVGLPRVPLVVEVEALPSGWALKSVRLGRRDITDVPADLSGVRDGPVEVVLTDRVARPIVRVIDDDGRPALSYRIVLLPADERRWRATAWNFEQPQQDDGSTRLGAVLPGEYLIAALRPADSYHWALAGVDQVQRVAEIATRVRLVEGEAQIIDLRLAKLGDRR